MKENAIYLRLLEALENQQYFQYATCWGAVPTTYTSGGGAYTWGAWGTDIIAAGTVTDDYAVVTAMVGQPSANANYEIEFAYGATDISCCYTKFCRSSPFISSLPIPARSARIPGGSRLRARMRDSAGGNTVQMCVFYKVYA